MYIHTLRILSYFPDVEAHKRDRDVVLVFNVLNLAWDANPRRDMFCMKNRFSGSFEIFVCHENCVPVSLLALVATVLNGPNIKEPSTSSDIEFFGFFIHAATSLQHYISQQLMHNMILPTSYETVLN
jgi:hypothetical protein